MVVFLVFILCVVYSITPSNSVGNPYFEFLQLALQNPKAVNITAKGDFTIHGLWPTNSTPLTTSGSAQNKYISIEVCPKYNNQHFNSSTLPQQLLTSLASCWPSYSSKKSNNQFWDDEYDKHGTCTLKKFITPEKYFSDACDVWSNYKVDTWLGNANIASNTLTPRANVESAVGTGFKHRAVLSCNGSVNGLKGNELKEVRLCFDARLNGIDCPNRKSNCQNNIVIAK